MILMRFFGEPRDQVDDNKHFFFMPYVQRVYIFYVLVMNENS